MAIVGSGVSRRLVAAAAALVATAIPALGSRPVDRPTRDGSASQEATGRTSPDLDPAGPWTAGLPSADLRLSEPKTIGLPNVHFPLDAELDERGRTVVSEELVAIFQDEAARVDGLPWTMLAAVAVVETNAGDVGHLAIAQGLTPIMGSSPEFLGLPGGSWRDVRDPAPLTAIPTPRDEIRAFADTVERRIPDPSDRSNPYAMAAMMLTVNGLYAKRLMAAHSDVTNLVQQGQEFVQASPTPSECLIVD